MSNKYILLITTIISLLFSETIIGQKKLIDHYTYKTWPEISGEKIGNNGKFIAYSCGNYQAGMKLVLQATDNTWERSFSNCESDIVNFISNGTRAILRINTDSIAILTLGSNKIEYIQGISIFKTDPSGKNDYLAYMKKENSNNLIICNTATRKNVQLSDVVDFEFSKNGEKLILQKDLSNINAKYFELSLFNLNNERQDSIWSGRRKVETYIVSEGGEKVAFLTPSLPGLNQSTEIWIYNEAENKTTQLVNENSFPPGLPRRIQSSNLNFNQNETELIFNLTYTSEKDIKKSNEPEIASVDIWSYKDAILQSEQLKQTEETFQYTASVNIKTKNVTKITSIEEEIVKVGGKLALIRQKGKANNFESNWNLNARPSFFIVSLMNGTRKLVKANLKNSFTSNIELSPDEKFVIYYDSDLKNYMSYNIETEITTNITKDINYPVYQIDYDAAGDPPPIASTGTYWLQNDKAAIIYDEYDIWLIDPEGIEKPENLTKGIGRNNNTILRVVKNENKLSIGEKLKLYAFNKINKESGFYTVKIKGKENAIKLTMGPFLYNTPPTGDRMDHTYIVSINYNLPEYPFIKAEKADIFIVRRCSVDNAPNIYATKDFKTFTQLSDIQPHKDFNWMKSEIVTWDLPNGKKNTGILYKPENFSEDKKYPLIIYCYDKLTDGLYQYVKPNLRFGDLSIPYFVSNGYLVFLPDIHFTVGQPGNSIYSTIVSAIDYLSEFSYINSKKLGLQGISFGGYVVNYLVTHTNLFAAAASSAGPTDFISGYGSIGDLGHSLQYQYETYQTRIGGTLWEKPDLYIANSPIFTANKVETPLLIMHNKNDGAVPWPQGVELFTALRRLNKKVWMLQYDNGTHGLGGIEAIDYSIRLSQFFDYYLKGSAPAKWMTSGVPARNKGKETGLDVDSSGIAP